jgi:hypothetical protein
MSILFFDPLMERSQMSTDRQKDRKTDRRREGRRKGRKEKGERNVCGGGKESKIDTMGRDEALHTRRQT